MCEHNKGGLLEHCNLAHSAHTVLVAVNLSHFFYGLGAKARNNGSDVRSVQQTLPERNPSQSTIHNQPLTNPALSDVSTIDLVFSDGGERSILEIGENASTGRRDARTSLFGPGGSENVILNVDAVELRSTSRITRMMAQDELAAMEQDPRLAMFRQKSRISLEQSKNISEQFETE